MPSNSAKRDKLREEEIQCWTVKHLRAQLKERKLGTNGTKPELVAKVIASEKMNNKQKKNARQRKQTNGDTPTVTKKHQQKEMEQMEREKIVLWRSPVTTLQYFVLEASVLLALLMKRIYNRKKTAAACLILAMILLLVYKLEGAHQSTVGEIERTVLWCAYWVGLGILSSVGLGTGLHTFLLYLGPHIAAVTLAAYECMTVDFPEPPYPNEIVCPDDDSADLPYISIWTIISKVRLEAFMWGAGTAIGELPPYFMARAARLSGEDLDDDEFEEIEELIHEKETHPSDLTKVSNSVPNYAKAVNNCIGLKDLHAKASVCNRLKDVKTVGLDLNPLTDMNEYDRSRFKGMNSSGHNPVKGISTFDRNTLKDVKASGDQPFMDSNTSGRIGPSQVAQFLQGLHRSSCAEGVSVTITIVSQFQSFLERLKLSVHNLVQRVGFFGILLCASIPNPLFDLAGITCGHFLIPFWTFFGATLIGKAIIKMHIQKLFVIFLFSEHHVENVVSLLGKLPKYGNMLQEPFAEYLRVQKQKLHHKPGAHQGESGTNILAWIFEKVVIVMVVYFLLSIINSMAQSYHKRKCKEKHQYKR